ncbi:tissue factor pathway inhibitor-like isoform X10 [Ostrea edulis]|uniref:tissue factor pathway inhibitor-like isoform X10 n=1 Tax=Ostrea edulis TaxID=37623 RepID=UPI0024AF07F9|nr:tissue factor pathway inhibitor-like isoform X10 [Ostrea edulis]
MELNRLLLVFTLCLISRTLAFETKKLSQPLQKDILTLKSEEPVRIPSETRIRQADEEEGEYATVDDVLSPPYLTSFGAERETNDSESEAEDSVCLQPKKPGPCKARMKRFYFNPANKGCEEFFYGGCQKNDNNFKSLEECRNKCIGN